MSKNYTNNIGYQISQPPQYTSDVDFERAEKCRTVTNKINLTPQESEAMLASGLEGWQALMWGIELGGGLTNYDFVMIRQLAADQQKPVGLIIKLAVTEYARNHKDRH